MLKKLNDAREYIDFINEINSDTNFSNPMLCNDEQIKYNLLDAVGKSSNHIFGIFEGKDIIGLFVFLILEDESYIEMLVGLSKEQKAYEEMLALLKKEYKGYNADFVYNPNNYLLHQRLQNKKAEFEVEQQKMVLKNEVLYTGNHQVELYSPKYREQYMAIHSNDVYWTADKGIAAMALYESMGFVKAVGENNMTAHVLL